MLIRMAKRAKRANRIRVQSRLINAKTVVDSLFDAVQPGREYESFLQVQPRQLDARTELRKAIEAIEAIRKRPLVCYLANVIRVVEGHTGIVEADDLPFAEMVDQVGRSETAVDILIATPGGFAHQVGKFVSHVRPRFDHVSFIIPHMAMSAGTIWALSGDEIWMDARGCLGPIDPQVPGKDGRLVPAQALLTFLAQIRREGEESIKQGLQPP